MKIYFLSLIKDGLLLSYKLIPEAADKWSLLNGIST